MSFIDFSLKKQTVTNFFTLLLIIVGIGSFVSMGKLEDPNFTVKTGLVITPYPGASPQEVEDEVTDLLEKAIAELPEVFHTMSLSRAGVSIITIDIKEEFWSDRIDQVWDMVRKKVNNVQGQMPRGAMTPSVVDDFSFVYGFVLSITGDGYSQKELEDYAHAIKREFSLVDGVSRVELWGDLQEAIYLNVSPEKLAELNLSPLTFVSAIGSQNDVVDSGSARIGDSRYRIATSGSFNDPSDIADLFIAPSSIENFEDVIGTPDNNQDQLLRIGDVAEVEEGYLQPLDQIMRFNGDNAIALMVANAADANVVLTGENMDAKLAEIEKRLPAGVKLNKIAWQSDLVTTAIDDFMISLMQAVVIVIVVLLLSMGLRMGLLIGANLVVVILGTFMVMIAMDLELQRVSLGSLIIALGMMVDNAIVVAEGYVVRVQQGVNKAKAAFESASKPMMPLLGATVIACMAFYPVFATQSDGGEYGRTLFIVVAISLVLSWVLSISVVPLWCQKYLNPEANDGEDPYHQGMYVPARRLLMGVLNNAGLFVLVMTGVLIVSVMLFNANVKQMFFPDAQRPQIMVDFWFPMGERIHSNSEKVKAAEEYILAMDEVESVSTFIGQGSPRFYLPTNPELPYSNYTQLIVNTYETDGPEQIESALEEYLAEAYPETLTRVRRYAVGPSDTWKLEWRIIGPADADRETLRAVAQPILEILDKSPLAKEVKLDMMDPVRTVEPQYDTAQGRWSGITRGDLASTFKYMTDGSPIGQYREGDRLYPIMLRIPPSDYERSLFSADTLSVKASDPLLSATSIPLGQIAPSVKNGWEDPILVRWDRKPSIAIQASPHQTTYDDLKSSIWEEVKAVELPPGYSLFLDGEDRSTGEAQAGLIPGSIVSGIVIVALLVLLMNSNAQPVMLLLIVPFAMIGISFGLILSGLPFGFMALLGAMSLAGMMIKNGIVLLDEVAYLLDEGKTKAEAIVEATISRIRPVLLAATTTVLGVIPLLTDAFWASMAITIMAGLAVGTLITLIMLPALYVLFYRVKMNA